VGGTFVRCIADPSSCDCHPSRTITSPILGGAYLRLGGSKDGRLKRTAAVFLRPPRSSVPVSPGRGSLWAPRSRLASPPTKSPSRDDQRRLGPPASVRPFGRRTNDREPGEKGVSHRTLRARTTSSKSGTSCHPVIRRFDEGSFPQFREPSGCRDPASARVPDGRAWHALPRANQCRRNRPSRNGPAHAVAGR
jgi:hypothetical protein